MQGFKLAVLLTCLAASDAIELTAPGNAVNIRANTSGYTLLINGEAWFESSLSSGGYRFSSGGHTFSALAGDLVPFGSPRNGTGKDPSGSYSSLTFEWTTNSSQEARSTPQWVSTFKLYHDRNAVVFQQQWPAGVQDARGGSSFPVLAQASSMQLGALEYTGSVLYYY